MIPMSAVPVYAEKLRIVSRCVWAAA